MEETFYNRISRYRSLNDVQPLLMRKVYTWMTLALVITGVTAFGVAASPTLFMNLHKMIWGLVIAELVLVFSLTCSINRLSLGTATLMFIGYSILNGATLSSIFYTYDMMVIAKVFFITAGTFGVTAFYGYTTKKNLATLGKVLFMALIGLLLATVVNLFLKSSSLDYMLSYAGVIIFTGLTAWDMQKIKKVMQQQYEESEQTQKIALIGALTLYLDFINLFLYFLKIFGNKK